MTTMTATELKKALETAEIFSRNGFPAKSTLKSC